MTPQGSSRGTPPGPPPGPWQEEARGRHRHFLVPAEEIHERIDRLREAMAGADAALSWIDHLSDRCYYAGTGQDGVLLLPRADEPVFQARLSYERATAESPLAVARFPGRRALLEAVRARLGADGRLGLALEVTPASTYVALAQVLGAERLVDIGPLIRRQRAVKSRWEIAQVRRAAEQVTALFGEVGHHLRPGLTELEVSAALEHRLRLLGHSGTVRVRRPGADLGLMYVVAGDSALYPTCFDGPVGAEGLYPYGAPGAGTRRIEAGQTVMLDIVSAANGYHADHTRTFWTGKTVLPEAVRAHALCVEALARIEALLRPGMACADLYAQVETWVRARGEPPGFMGHGDNRVKFFGHGVGLELDEWPVLAARFDLELAEGMVVAVEPKAFLPGVGPVGVENTYVVTADGCEPLCAFSREIMCVG